MTYVTFRTVPIDHLLEMASSSEAASEKNGLTRIELFSKKPFDGQIVDRSATIVPGNLKLSADSISVDPSQNVKGTRMEIIVRNDRNLVGSWSRGGQGEQTEATKPEFTLIKWHKLGSPQHLKAHKDFAPIRRVLHDNFWIEDKVTLTSGKPHPGFDNKAAAVQKEDTHIAHSIAIIGHLGHTPTREVAKAFLSHIKEQHAEFEFVAYAHSDNEVLLTHPDLQSERNYEVQVADSLLKKFAKNVRGRSSKRKPGLSSKNPKGKEAAQGTEGLAPPPFDEQDHGLSTSGEDGLPPNFDHSGL